NNHAERVIRPLVVTRKISGGSRSVQGAQTHMVNMSVFQTIKLKNQPLTPTLKEYLLNGAVGKN
ncbi:transposase, partial [Candidatus Roizmanbacteria bacterium]|nr:transposase [Candidatus Roizmanbacteria bacterium]